MKANYDFSAGRRGAVLSAGAGKERITIRLDREVLAWFRAQVEQAGGGNYQTLINRALHEYMNRQEGPLEDVLRRVVREELQAVR
jgi:uncharacterized protein (DUF4415 family)